MPLKKKEMINSVLEQFKSAANTEVNNCSGYSGDNENDIDGNCVDGNCVDGNCVDENGVDDTEKRFFVYLLSSSDGATYVGATVNLERRLRQHNKEIVGGAYATGAKVGRGEIWERALHIEGFPTWSAALQFEWRFKQLSRKFPKKMYPLERRIRALKMLVELDRPTSKAEPYSKWGNAEGGPVIILETEEAEIIYTKVFKSV